MKFVLRSIYVIYYNLIWAFFMADLHSKFSREDLLMG